MCQCRFNDCSNMNHSSVGCWWHAPHCGRLCVCGRREISVFAAQCCCEPNTALNKQTSGSLDLTCRPWLGSAIILNILCQHYQMTNMSKCAKFSYSQLPLPTLFPQPERRPFPPLHWSANSFKIQIKCVRSSQIILYKTPLQAPASPAPSLITTQFAGLSYHVSFPPESQPCEVRYSCSLILFTYSYFPLCCISGLEHRQAHSRCSVNTCMNDSGRKWAQWPWAPC